MKRNDWGFKTRDMDRTVRAQDDFYRFASGGWLLRNPIPKNEARWGSFMILRYDTDKKLHAIVRVLEDKKSVPAGTPERLIRDFYRSGMNIKRRNALGLIPLSGLLKRIETIQDTKDLMAQVAALHTAGVGVLFGSAVDQDSKASTKYILHLYQDGLGMPERDYYLKNDAESKRVRNAYTKHIEALFRLMGKSTSEARDGVRAVLTIETKLAQISMSKEDRRDADKVYHKKTLRELQKLSPAVFWNQYMKDIGAGTPKAVIAMQPQFLKGMSTLIRSIPISDWKTYLAFHTVNDYAGYLSEAFVRQSFAFYGTVLSGTKVMKPLWRRILGAVNGHAGEALGRIYVKKHFTETAKRKMDALVDDLFEAYEARLKHLDWMTPGTKKKALRKLRAMNRKIGYPKKWKSYAGLHILPDDFAGNAYRSHQFAHKREMKKLRKPIDREEWFMYPQSVNAYFAPNLNDIVFPAAILQPPFFNENADDALNYGAIGSVIGHEITHGFDDQGSKYDEKGNLKSWWTASDRARFMKKAEIIRKQYDQYEVADGVKVNGKLTLGENIADLGGLSIAYDAYMRRLQKTGRKNIAGFTPEQRFFLGFTLFDRENARPEFQKMQVLTDPHSPGQFRINGPASNMNSFYDAYGVKGGDKLFRDKKERTTVW